MVSNTGTFAKGIVAVMFVSDQPLLKVHMFRPDTGISMASGTAMSKVPGAASCRTSLECLYALQYGFSAAIRLFDEELVSR